MRRLATYGYSRGAPRVLCSVCVRCEDQEQSRRLATQLIDTPLSTLEEVAGAELKKAGVAGAVGVRQMEVLSSTVEQMDNGTLAIVAIEEASREARYFAIDAPTSTAEPGYPQNITLQNGASAS